MYIPYGKQLIDEEDIQAVCEALRSDYLTTGPMVSEFEKMVANYVGSKYAIAVANGTAALHVACLAAGIGVGDEVITTPMTFAASANCIIYCGGEPVFADIDFETYNIDSKEIKNKITSRTKAILPVHYTGQPCDLSAIHEIAKEHNLIVIEDAAHAFGAEYKGKKIGGLSDLSTFSFHPVKHITTGEGGMVTTNDSELYERLKLFRTHGITRDPKLMTKNEGAWYYEQIDLGFNYRITDFQCALGITQIKKSEQFLKRRREIANRYDEAFRGLGNIACPFQMKDTLSSYHLYVIQVPENLRAEIFRKLREAGIGANVHYLPVYKHPYYQNHGFEEASCPNAETLYRKIISLPMHPGLDEKEIQYIISVVRNILN